MNTQDEFSRRIAARLEENLQTLPQNVLARLEQARESALAHSPRKSASLLNVGGGTLAASWHLAKNKMALIAMILAVVVAGGAAQYRAIQNTANEAADIDETILSGQAPVQSYLDPGFAAVLHAGVRLRSSESDH